MHAVGRVAADKLEKRERPADRGDDHAEDGGGHRRLVADRPAAETGDQGAGQRREDGESVEHRQPFIRLTSSTWIDPRLRK